MIRYGWEIGLPAVLMLRRAANAAGIPCERATVTTDANVKSVSAWTRKHQAGHTEERPLASEALDSAPPRACRRSPHPDRP